MTDCGAPANTLTTSQLAMMGRPMTRMRRQSLKQPRASIGQARSNILILLSLSRTADRHRDHLMRLKVGRGALDVGAPDLSLSEEWQIDHRVLRGQMAWGRVEWQAMLANLTDQPTTDLRKGER